MTLQFVFSRFFGKNVRKDDNYDDGDDEGHGRIVRRRARENERAQKNVTMIDGLPNRYCPCSPNYQVQRRKAGEKVHTNLGQATTLFL